MVIGGLCIFVEELHIYMYIYVREIQSEVYAKIHKYNFFKDIYLNDSLK